MSLEDKAQEHEAQQWELRNIHRKALPPPAAPGDHDYGPALCDDCEAPMPPLRRAWRLSMCTACTTEVERQAAMRRPRR